MFFFSFSWCAETLCEVEDSDTTPVEQISKGCTRTKQTFWTDDQLVVTTSPGIRDRETKVTEIVARELQKAKLASGDVCRLTSLGQRRRRHTCPIGS